jgi:hypothetical protein
MASSCVRTQLRDGYQLGAKKCMINVGSVGQPRDGDPRACYAILEGDGSGSAEWNIRWRKPLEKYTPSLNWMISSAIVCAKDDKRHSSSEVLIVEKRFALFLVLSSSDLDDSPDG